MLGPSPLANKVVQLAATLQNALKLNQHLEPEVLVECEGISLNGTYVVSSVRSASRYAPATQCSTSTMSARSYSCSAVSHESSRDSPSGSFISSPPKS